MNNISDTFTEAEKALNMWLDQYAIGFDKDRERRPEIIATRAVLEKIKIAKKSLEVK